MASWLIIIGYLWFRFKSLTYGLAAVLAVVGVVISGLALWNSYSERTANEADRAAEENVAHDQALVRG